MVRLSSWLALLLLVWAPGQVGADELVAAHLSALRESLDVRAAAALDRIEGMGPRLLAARSYLRGAARLPERWSWTQEQIDAYRGSPAQAALDAEIARIREIFEASKPGYTLYVNPQVRSLDIQLQHWNENRSVADAGRHLLEAMRAVVGAGRARPVTPRPDARRGLPGEARGDDGRRPEHGTGAGRLAGPGLARPPGGLRAPSE